MIGNLTEKKITAFCCCAGNAIVVITKFKARVTILVI